MSNIFFFFYDVCVLHLKAAVDNALVNEGGLSFFFFFFPVNPGETVSLYMRVRGLLLFFFFLFHYLCCALISRLRGEIKESS